MVIPADERLSLCDCLAPLRRGRPGPAAAAAAAALAVVPSAGEGCPPPRGEGDEDGPEAAVAAAYRNFERKCSGTTELPMVTSQSSLFTLVQKKLSSVSIHSDHTPGMVSHKSSTNGHPLQAKEKLLSCIQLLRAEVLPSLPVPLPRAQDLSGEHFGRPMAGDQVISVSHAWRNQMHPDPTGQKTKVLCALLPRLMEELEPGKHIFLFLDFVSISQRPFQAGQAPRTADEVARFREALLCMHEMYFYSDRVIHLPWDDSSLEGEGETSTIPARKLVGATLGQVGECVQITELPPAEVQPGASVRLFDQVVAVDGEPVTSLQHAELLLGGGGGGGAKAAAAALRRCPCGLCNHIPSDERGWVFLERFITMVKCAMVDEASAQKIVVTPCPVIFEQIISGAWRLREASLRDLQSGRREALAEVFQDFTLELKKKRFSAASADKREMSSSQVEGIEEDRDVVLGIMREFVEHLSAHWEEEAVRQRRMVARAVFKVVEAAETYLLDWDPYTLEFSSQVSGGPSRGQWPIAGVCVLPLLCPFLVLLLPYARPDEGWSGQSLFWACGLPTFWFVCVAYMPVFLYRVGQVRVTAAVQWKGLAFAATSTLVGVTVVLALAWHLDAFPVPLTNTLGPALTVPQLPLLWKSVPLEKRSSSEFQRLAIAGLVGVALILLLFGNFMPFMVEALSFLSPPWQAVLVFGFVGLKLAFEAVGVRLKRHIGAEAMPMFIFTAVVSYQTYLCVAFVKGSSWVVGFEAMSFDLLENGFYLWSACRQGLILREGPEEARRSARLLREQYIVISLMLREFVEVMLPLQFLLIYTALWHLRPESMALFCGKSQEEVLQAQLVLLADIVLELALFGLSWALLVRQGHSPLRMLRGVLARNFLYSILWLQAFLAWVFTEQHSHWGMKKTFDWAWIWEAEAQWVCGLTWSVA